MAMAVMVDSDTTAVAVVEADGIGGFVAGGYFGGGGGGGSSYYGGLPSPASDSNSPAEVSVTNPSYGTETGGVQIQIISVAQV